MEICQRCSGAKSWLSALKRATFLVPCSQCGQYGAWHCLDCPDSACKTHRSSHSTACGHSAFLSPTGLECFCVECENDPRDSLSSEKVPGNTGFKNLGSTCYMNVGLQCLLHTQPLLAYLSQVLAYVKLPGSLTSL